jgi:hypothetical protein
METSGGILGLGMDEQAARAHRVNELAGEAIGQAEALQRTMERLLSEIATPPPAAEAGSRDGSLDAARLAAIEMAVAGRTRSEVEEHLRATYALEDLDALLDDVFGAGV